jgi:flagellar hook-basal body complex protein FliE
MISIDSFSMIRTNPDHIGSGPVVSSRSKMVSGSNMIEGLSRSETGSFEQTLLDAFDQVNGAQQRTDVISQQLITDPDSVDVHDVTIAMAEASLSLNIAQTVVDRVIQSWNDITTTR